MERDSRPGWDVGSTSSDSSERVAVTFLRRDSSSFWSGDIKCMGMMEVGLIGREQGWGD